MGKLLSPKVSAPPAAPEAEKPRAIEDTNVSADNKVRRNQRKRYGVESTVTAGAGSGSSLGSSPSGYRQTLG